MSRNILLVSDYYPPFLGGAQRQTQLIAKSLVRRGHRVSVATLWHPGMQPLEDDDGVAVYRMRQLRTALAPLARKIGEQHPPPFPDPIIAWELRRIIDRLKPDLIHAYGWIAFSCGLALIGRRIPLLVSARDYGMSCPTRILLYERSICDGPALGKCLRCAPQEFGPARGFLATIGVRASRRILLRKMTALHSVSTFVHDVMERDLLRHAPTRVTHEVIPSFRETAIQSTPANLAEYLDRLPKGPFMLFVGELRMVKGLNQLFSAYQRLNSPPPLVLLGHSAADTPTSYPSGVIPVGAFPHPAVMAAWERCLFGITPSLWPEPLGSVVHEAMSMGKAIIGTKPGGHTDMIVDGETGFLVPAGDVEGLARAMRFLLDHPQQCQALGAAGRARAERFVAAHTLPRFEALYERLACNALPA